MSDKPYYSAAQRALVVYRSEMRAFIVRNLRAVRGEKPEQIISEAIGHAAVRFDAKIRDGEKIENCIDIGDFPFILDNRGRNPFVRILNGKRDLIDNAHNIRKSRNIWAHPPEEDIEKNTAIKCLINVIEALNAVNRRERAAEVEKLLDGIINPAPVQPEEPQESKEEPQENDEDKSGESGGQETDQSDEVEEQEENETESENGGISGSQETDQSEEEEHESEENETESENDNQETDQSDEEVRETLPKAWSALIEEESEDLLDAVKEITASLYEYTPATEQTLEFLKRLELRNTTAPTPAPVQSDDPLSKAWSALIQEEDEYQEYLLDAVEEKTEELCGHTPSADQMLDFLKRLELDEDALETARRERAVKALKETLPKAWSALVEEKSALLLSAFKYKTPPLYRDTPATEQRILDFLEHLEPRDTTEPSPALVESARWISDAWNALIEEKSAPLLDAVKEKTEELCDHTPSAEQTLDFLRRLEPDKDALEAVWRERAVKETLPKAWNALVEEKSALLLSAVKYKTPPLYRDTPAAEQQVLDFLKHLKPRNTAAPSPALVESARWISDAWDALIEEESAPLLDAVKEKTTLLCEHTPTSEQTLDFLKRLEPYKDALEAVWRERALKAVKETLPKAWNALVKEENQYLLYAVKEKTTSLYRYTPSTEQTIEFLKRLELRNTASLASAPVQSKDPLSKAWSALIEEESAPLLEAVKEKTEKLCGHTPAPEQILDFLKRLVPHSPPTPPFPSPSSYAKIYVYPNTNGYRTRLVVELPDGQTIDDHIAATTFAKTIESIGVERVYPLNISAVHGPVVAEYPPPRSQRQIGDYYIDVETTTRQKAEILKKIGDRLSVPLKIKIVPKEPSRRRTRSIPSARSQEERGGNASTSATSRIIVEPNPENRTTRLIVTLPNGQVIDEWIAATTYQKTIEYFGLEEVRALNLYTPYGQVVSTHPPLSGSKRQVGNYYITVESNTRQKAETLKKIAQRLNKPIHIEIVPKDSRNRESSSDPIWAPAVSANAQRSRESSSDPTARSFSTGNGKRRATRLRVAFPNSPNTMTIDHHIAVDTFVDAIEAIGIEQVARLNKYMNGHPLVTTRPLITAPQRQHGRYYITTHSSTIVKKKTLDEIAKELGIALKVEIVQK